MTTAVRIPLVATGSQAVAAAPAPSPSTATPPAARAMPSSRPVRLEIPRLGVRTGLLTLGRGADGSPRTPPVSRPDRAGWYRYGAAPGSAGSAVIAGHADSAAGPAVFARLGELRPGDEVVVLRRDGREAVFAVERVERVSGDRFPVRRVYGKVSYPGIRLVAHGGAGDVIAYGRLVRST
ncbi:sortase domain-containing protein [Thermomonospora cellulosilytica]|uniref:Sortase family protein n=1 Tax=Thermomonospora cellulosilytica TaxID=1411118 RepID=A0A7W3MTW5_9ACTN|nr:sortase [Thermomonospora cellulosilytica]MBA9001779.1 hypothetical protein [Thermomonospora cellulosilytica]